MTSNASPEIHNETAAPNGVKFVPYSQLTGTVNSDEQDATDAELDELVSSIGLPENVATLEEKCERLQKDKDALEKDKDALEKDKAAADIKMKDLEMENARLLKELQKFRDSVAELPQLCDAGVEGTSAVASGSTSKVSRNYGSKSSTTPKTPRKQAGDSKDQAKNRQEQLKRTRSTARREDSKRRKSSGSFFYVHQVTDNEDEFYILVDGERKKCTEGGALLDEEK
ncbi:hypothetical protein C8J56DRAFT_1031840 [Mycena floridula]|nr:hypothetical protein C8J56DRAFT_1031840 [Mycena floridula]